MSKKTVKEEEKKVENKTTKINMLISKKTKRNSKTKKKNIRDNYMRKDCKHILLNHIFNFINEKICEKYDNNIGQAICIKQLQTLNQEQKSKTNIDFNKEFINKKLYQIFSENISSKLTNFIKTHNKDIIQDLLNEQDIEIKTYFNKLLNLTFFQCLEHFRGNKVYEELKGMPVLIDEIKKYNEEDEYEYI